MAVVFLNLCPISFSKNINEVFYFSTLLGYALFIILAIPFITFLLLTIRKNGEVVLHETKAFTFILLVQSSFLLTAGCWDIKDIETLTFVRGVGIDETDDQGVKLTYQNLIPNMGGTKEAASTGYVNVVSKGKNVLEAVSHVALKDQPIYSDHLKIFVRQKSGRATRYSRNTQSLYTR